MRVLEIGSYVSVAYAGMILAEQGHQVTKWVSPERPDPVQELIRGEELWKWLNKDKKIVSKHAETIRNQGLNRVDPGFDLIIDNVRAETWERWKVSPSQEALRMIVPWVSLRDDFDGRGFDAIAQARAWGDHIGYVPAYLGDTAGGLWLAFKALSLYANRAEGHHVIRQAAVLAKLVEGELMDVDRNGFSAPWDPPGTYGVDPHAYGTQVHYRGEVVREPFRDGAWRRKNIPNDQGRIIV
jgi:crotonobetainyl-CoA:carnitine CoA-transferase CaiB-like acyl-CoA transferase